MANYPPPNIEVDRLLALARYDINDTPTDPVLNAITKAAADLCDTPFAMISLIDASHNQLKFCVGIPETQIPRDVAFCAYAILQPTALMEVENAHKDRRFHTNPMVTHDPKIRFYAGMPLVTSDHFALGTLCVMGYRPQQLSAAQRAALSQLAQVVMNIIEQHHLSEATETQTSQVPAMRGKNDSDEQSQNEMLRLRARAMESLDVGVSITDATKKNHPLVYVNQTLCKLSGYSAGELLGQGVKILQKNDQHQPEHVKIREAQAKGESVQVRFNSTHKNGSHYIDELSLSPVHNDSGDLTHYVGINRDITSIVETEERVRQAQKIEAIGQLSGGIAHDFNNLLNVITGSLEFLSTEIRDDKQREILNDADHAAQMAARLTRRLLSFAKQNKVEPMVLNPNDHILGAMELLQSTIGEAISLSSNLSQGLWNIRADPSEVENIIVNLVINARDAMPNGGKVNIATKNVTFTSEDIQENDEMSEGDYVRITVSDDGSGMSAEVKKRIFEPFFTTKEHGKGTGLGLSSIHGFVKQSSGHLNVYSEEGHGTAFNLYLPRQTEFNRKKVSKAVPKLARSQGDAQILVVEDNELVRKLTLKRLQSLGYKAEQVSNGPDAIDYLKKHADIDLVLSDIIMEGGMSGYDVARWILKNSPQIKILLTSGFSEHLAKVNNIESVELKVLQKPYSLTELQHVLTAVLDIKLVGA